MQTLPIPIDLNALKHTIPLIWLDTSVFSHLGKAAAGKNIEPNVRERVERLASVIQDKLKHHALVCVKADQDEEIAYCTEFVEPIRDAMTQLTWEMRMSHRKEVFFFQAYRAMEAYLNRSTYLSFSFKDASRGCNKFSNFPWLVRVNMPLPDEIMGATKTAKIAITQKWENLRKNLGDTKTSYDQQRIRELNGFHWAVTTLIAELKANESSIDDDRHYDWSVLWMYWGLINQSLNATSDSKDFLQFLHFLRSPYFHAMPCVDTSASLLADLLTGTKEISTGDWMDVNQLSAVLPYCDIVLTDAAMAGRIRRRRIHQQWNTRVYTLKEVEDLIEDLNSLRPTLALTSKVQHRT